MTKTIQKFALFTFLIFFAVACGGSKEEGKGESEENNSEEEAGNSTETKHANEVIELNKSAEVYSLGAGIAKLTLKNITMDFFPEGKEVLLGDDEEIIRFDVEITNENDNDFKFNYTDVRLNTTNEKDIMTTSIINKGNVDDLISEQGKVVKKGGSIKGALYFKVKKGAVKQEDMSFFIRGYDADVNEKNTEIFLKDE